MMQAGVITSDTVAESVSSALRSAVSGLSAPGKRVARCVGKNARTIRNIMEGANAPSAATLIQLMREFDEVHEAVLCLADRNSVKPSGLDNHRIQQIMSILSGGEHAENNTDPDPRLGRIIEGQKP